jgi:hypothetical protein
MRGWPSLSLPRSSSRQYFIAYCTDFTGTRRFKDPMHTPNPFIERTTDSKPRATSFGL